jgi:hypothetical protein
MTIGGHTSATLAPSRLSVHVQRCKTDEKDADQILQLPRHVLPVIRSQRVIPMPRRDDRAGSVD